MPCGVPKKNQAKQTKTWGACFFFFLNYENVTHLQETWEIQDKVAYNSTIYILQLFF